CRPVEQRPVVTVEKFPVGDAPGAARAFERGRELRPDFARVPVAQLVEHAAVLVENPMVLVNQPEERVTAEEAGAHAFAFLCVEIADPRTAVGIVVDGDYVLLRNTGGQHADGKRDLRSALR